MAEPVSCSARSKSGESRTRRTEEVVREEMAVSIVVRVWDKSVEGSLLVSIGEGLGVGGVGTIGRAGIGLPRIGRVLLVGGAVLVGNAFLETGALGITEDEPSPSTKANLLLWASEAKSSPYAQSISIVSNTTPARNLRPLAVPPSSKTPSLSSS